MLTPQEKADLERGKALREKEEAEQRAREEARLRQVAAEHAEKLRAWHEENDRAAKTLGEQLTSAMRTYYGLVRREAAPVELAAVPVPMGKNADGTVRHFTPRGRRGVDAESVLMRALRSLETGPGADANRQLLHRLTHADETIASRMALTETIESLTNEKKETGT